MKKQINKYIYNTMSFVVVVDLEERKKLARIRFSCIILFDF
jgi:hypothetical protein